MAYLRARYARAVLALPRVGFWGKLLAWFRAPRARSLAEQALRHGLADLQIGWPVRLVWEKDLLDLGQVNCSRRGQITLRAGQDPEEGMRTTFHEVYHLAQFH